MNPGGSPEAAPEARRRLTLIDGMVLISAFAVCCVVPRLFDRWLAPRGGLNHRLLVPPGPMKMVICWATICSATLALLEAFGPGPAGIRRFRRPGGLAMLMVVVTWGYVEARDAGWDLGYRLRGHDTSKLFRMHGIFRPILQASDWNGLAILACWATLILVGAWKPSRGDWVDRSGRVLGALWLLYGLASWLADFFYPPLF